jgi:hypothetical protein
VSRKGNVAQISVHVPKVERPDGTKALTRQRDREKMASQDGLVFHIQVGYKTLALVVAILFQVAFAYADAIANLFGYKPLP